jgi:hypothetical protein
LIDWREEDFAMRIKLVAFFVALAGALAMQSAASACTVTPAPGGTFYGEGLIGQYCWINPPAAGAVTGQCWGCTGGGWRGPKCGWHPFAGTAEPAGPPNHGYIFNVYSDIGNTIKLCGQ